MPAPIANAQPKLHKDRYRIDGMDCASCAAKIDAAVRRLPGVKDASVSVAAGSLTLSHDGTADSGAVQQRVKALGYGITPTVLGKPSAPLPAQSRHHAHGHGSEKPESCGSGHDHSGDDHGHHHEHGHHHTHQSAQKDSHDAACCGGCDHQHASADQAQLAANTAPEVPKAVERLWWQTPKARLTALCGLALVLAYGVGHIFPAIASPLFIVALGVGLIPIAQRAFSAARFGTPFSIETLMTIAATGAVIIGAVEEAGVVVFLFLLGEMLEGVAANKARASIASLTDLVPKTAWRERSGNGGLQEIPATQLAIGDIILVRPGDRIAADGTIVSGTGLIDEAPVTGESQPVRKDPNDQVFAGTINIDSALRIAVTATSEDNTIARVIKLVEEAQEAKSPTERFIDRFSSYYTPSVLVAGALVAVVPPLLFGASWSEWIYKGLALLLIGCPCALVISTPAAIAAGLATGARRGLLMKGGAVLEQIGKVTTVAFDKTGTLTEGKPVVTDIVAFVGSERDVMAQAAALETGSSHPLAKAILARAAADNASFQPAANITVLAGKGLSGQVNGQELSLVSPSGAQDITALNADMNARIDALNAEGKTVSVLLVDGHIAGLIAMRDEPRPDARDAIHTLKKLGIDAVMLTGDRRPTAEAIARDLGITPYGELLPENKQSIVREMQANGSRVAKVGDGINDAPALAAADVGIAMGGGTDVALETADAASLHARVMDIPRMVQLSRRTMFIIKQNITIALGLKAVFLITTLIGITGLWPAILADTGATVLVTANAMRLLSAHSTAEYQSPMLNSRPSHAQLMLRLALPATSAVIVLLIDQLTKSLAREFLHPGPFGAVAILPFLNFQLGLNTGVSFGLLSDLPMSILAGLNLSLTLFIIVWIVKTPSARERFGLSLMVGGAIGNLSDRLHRGGVVDFIDLHVADWHWPAFNVADIGIVIGAITIIFPSVKSNQT